MASLTDKYEKDDRLPVLVSSRSGFKLLGAPALPVKSTEATGDLIGDVTYKLLSEWSCTSDICSMVFDTTNSNTGQLSAACIQIQDRLNKALLWAGCRKHIGEVVLRHVWDDLKIEASKSPNITLFQKFRDSYKAIPYSDTSLYKIFNQTRTPQILKDMIADVTSVLQNIKKADVYRDDYQELINLTVTYLGVNEEYTFLKPGAVHRARWLAKTLYCLKSLCSTIIYLKAWSIKVSEN